MSPKALLTERMAILWVANDVPKHYKLPQLDRSYTEQRKNQALPTWKASDLQTTLLKKKKKKK